MHISIIIIIKRSITNARLGSFTYVIRIRYFLKSLGYEKRASEFDFVFIILMLWVGI